MMYPLLITYQKMKKKLSLPYKNRQCLCLQIRVLLQQSDVAKNAFLPLVCLLLSASLDDINVASVLFFIRSVLFLVLRSFQRADISDMIAFGSDSFWNNFFSSFNLRISFSCSWVSCIFAYSSSDCFCWILISSRTFLSGRLSWSFFSQSVTSFSFIKSSWHKCS